MIDIFGYLSALCFSLCYIPQLRKTWVTKSVEDISVHMWLLQGAAYSTGLVYGYALNSIPLTLNYLLGLCYTLLWLAMWKLYRDPAKAQAQKVIRDAIKDAKRKKK